MTVSNFVPKYDPVAVVYYRYDDQAAAQGYVHNGLYYIHNGVALANLPLASGEAYSGAAFMSHVPEWSATGPQADRVWICDQTKAAEAHKAGHGKREYMWSRIMDGTTEVDSFRLWVWTRIHPYAGPNAKGDPQNVRDHLPISWVEDNNLKSPHNGVFDSFNRTNGSFTLHYYHWMNAQTRKPHEDDRTATEPDRFTLEKKSLAGKIEQVMIASQPPRGLWS